MPVFMRLLPAGTIATCVLFAGCGILPAVPVGGYRNVASTPESPRLERTDVNLSPSNLQPNAFVGVAFSGGGSRAAVFGASVLQRLDEAGFLDHVTAFSAVSGGGLPAAKFALDGEQIRTPEEWAAFKLLMSEPYRTKWLVKQLLPHNALRIALTQTTRTDLMSEVFDEYLFGNRTFKDLGQSGKRRPKLFLNATETVGEPGSRFTFSTVNFNLLLSDLSRFPISLAATASAAFPGVYNPVTLRRYPTSAEKRGQPAGFELYHHLLDGGPSDNLGIEALTDAVRAHRSRWLAQARETGDSRPFKCMLILVDAYPSSSDTNRGFEEESRRGFIDYFVDRGFVDAFDALLSRRRADLLRRLGFDLKMPAQVAFFNTHTAGGGDDVYRVGDWGLHSVVRPYQRVREVVVGEDRGEAYSCYVWHIALSQINSVPHSYDAVPPTVQGRNVPSTHPVLLYRQRLWHLVNRVPTDFNLVGPPNCSRAFLLRALDSASKVLINEDARSRQQACAWFRGAFPDAALQCEHADAGSHEELGLEMSLWPNVQVSCASNSAEQH